jgi:holin-like protein
MINAITILLIYQLVGESLVLALGLPVPGPVVGMLLLFLSLLLRGGASPDLRDTAQGILQHLSLLFVPAGVGVMVHGGRVAAEWLPIVTALVLSTVATILVTALTMRFVLSRTGKGVPSDDE